MLKFQTDPFILNSVNRPAVVRDDRLQIKKNPDHTTQNIADILYISHMRIVRHLKDTWIHELLQCLGALKFNRKKCNGLHFLVLLKCNQYISLILKRMIIGD